MDIKELLGDKYKDGMTAEEQLAALAEVSIEQPDTTALEQQIAKYKAAFDKAAHEAAERKKQLEQGMTDAEKQLAERDSQLKEITDKLEALERDRSMAQHRASLLGIGYSDELAASAAEALVSGNTTVLFDTLKKFGDQVAKKAKESALLDTPKPPAGGSGDEGAGPKIPKTADEFAKLSYEEMAAFKAKAPDEFSKFLAMPVEQKSTARGAPAS
jgi:HD-GYP domain-containing protein (c-di-GMP phosphodiesterase class II)